MTHLPLGTTAQEQNRTHQIPDWVLIGLFVLIALAMIIGGSLFFRYQTQQIRARQIDDLQTIAELKVDQFVQWRLERLGDARSNSSNPFFHKAVIAWAANPDDTGLKSDLQATLRLFVEVYGYQNALITGPDGQMLLSFDPQLTSLEETTRLQAAQASANGQPVFGDFFRSPADQKVYLDIAAPILDDSGRPAAVLVLRMDPETYLFPLIQSWPTPSHSAETLLVRRDGDDVLYLNTLRHRADPPLTIRIPLTSTGVPAVQAVLGTTGIYEGTDYREESVLSVLTPVPGSPWFMVAKVDSQEMLAEIRALGLTVGLFVLLSVFMTAVLAVYTLNNRERRLYQRLFHAEQQERLAQEETRTTLYSIGDGVLTTDDQGRVKRLNPVAEQLTGWQESEARDKPLEQVFHIINEITRAKVENPVTIVLRNGQVVGLANHSLLIARDGTERPIADSGAPIYDDNGTVTGVVLVFRDQTEERAREKERSLLSGTISASVNEIYIFDAATWLFRYANNGALHNLGYSMEEMQAKTPLYLKPEIGPDEFQRILQPLIDQKKAVQVFETVHQRAGGSLYPVEVRLQLFDHEGDRVFLAVIQDITERKQVENLLLEREKVMQYIIKYDPNAIAVYDQNLHYIAASDRYLQDYNIQGQNIIGMHHYDVFPEMPQKWKDVHQRVLAGAIERDDDDFFVRTDGSITYNRWECRPWYRADGKIGGMITYTEVITERKQAEIKLKEQLEELSRWHAATLGREERILELKREVNQLLEITGQPPRYASAPGNAAEKRAESVNE